MSSASEAKLCEMREAGYDVSTMTEERERLLHHEAGLELIPLITEAFIGVRLGDGVGLYHAQGLDDYEDQATCARYRAEDEKDDWTAITSDKLRQCHSSLSFFDAEGFRFHLPAYLICDLRGEYGFGMAFCLAYSHPESDDRFRLLTVQQRIVVRLFLLHILHDRDNEYDRPHVERALESYWRCLEPTS
jgi:hypothetical protein